MNRELKKIVLGLCAFATVHSDCSIIDLAATYKDTILDYAVKIASVGVIAKTIHHFSKLYKIDTTSVDNLVTQLRYNKYLAERFLESHDEIYKKYNSLDTPIVAHFSGYTYPAHAYYANLKTLIANLTALESAFQRKKSQTKNVTKWQKIDHCIEVITILNARLVALYDVVPHSKIYLMEKAARKWPVKTAVFSLITGAILSGVAVETVNMPKL